MALISCPECMHKTSDSAELCPECGFNISKYIAQQIIKSSISGELKDKVTIKEGSTKITSVDDYSDGDITIIYVTDTTKYAVYSTSSASGDLDTSNWK